MATVPTEQETIAPAKKARIGSSPDFSIEGDSTEETPFQKGIVAAHFGFVLLNALRSLGDVHLSNPSDLVSMSLTVIASIILGDLGTGVFHWSVDNYGGLKTPVVGSVCAAFQGHHSTPWTITFRSFANNLYKIAVVTVPTLALLSMAPVSGEARLFFALFINWWLLSQEFHKWSHMRQLPNESIRYFQDNGIILSRKEHGLHHTSPFEGNYCILTGVCNPVLDDSGFFRKLEALVYDLTGNVPNCWKEDPSLAPESLRKTIAEEYKDYEAK
jgi:ubiquitin-conjugating enzyme E2 variant